MVGFQQGIPGAQPLPGLTEPLSSSASAPALPSPGPGTAPGHGFASPASPGRCPAPARLPSTPPAPHLSSSAPVQPRRPGVRRPLGRPSPPTASRGRASRRGAGAQPRTGSRPGPRRRPDPAPGPSRSRKDRARKAGAGGGPGRRRPGCRERRAVQVKCVCATCWPRARTARARGSPGGNRGTDLRPALGPQAGLRAHPPHAECLPRSSAPHEMPGDSPHLQRR